MKKVLDLAEKTIKVVCICQMIIIVSVLFYAVAMRYVFHLPPAWSMEVSRYLFIWMIILSATLITREQNHIQITFLTNMMPQKVRFVWMNVMRLLMIAFCFVVIRQGLAIYPVVAEARSPSLNISMGWLYLAIPAGGLLMGIYILENIVRSMASRFGVGAPTEDRKC
jgi:TRAP-type C4-dicarboxylate transport system permease small subunit